MKPDNQQQPYLDIKTTLIIFAIGILSIVFLFASSHI